MPKTLKDAEKACLSRIKWKFGSIIRKAGEVYGFRPAIIGGLCMRESHGGELLDKDLLGDAGHGHGLMQIDDRSFLDFCSNPALYKNPVTNILKGCAVLKDKLGEVQHICAKFAVEYTPEQFERMYVAAYNCGSNNPVHALRNQEDIDTYTTGKDYSAAVEAYADFYASDPTPEGEEGTKQYTA